MHQNRIRIDDTIQRKAHLYSLTKKITLILLVEPTKDSLDAHCHVRKHNTKKILGYR